MHGDHAEASEPESHKCAFSSLNPRACSATIREHQEHLHDFLENSFDGFIDACHALETSTCTSCHEFPDLSSRINCTKLRKTSLKFWPCSRVDLLSTKLGDACTYERSHLVLVEVSHDVVFHPILLEDKMLTFPQGFFGGCCECTWTSAGFLWLSHLEARGFRMGLCSTGVEGGVLTGHLLRASIIHSEIARRRSGVQSSVVFCGCLLILTWALDMPLTCLELLGGEKMKVPWSDVLLDRYVAADSQHWSCLQLCRCRTSLGGENEQCTVCACTQLPYKN